jgi:arylsulfatase A-like enzyme
VKGYRLWDTFTNQLVAIEPPATYTQDLFVQRALDFIQRNATNRFFLYLPFTPPHANSTMKRIDVPEIEPEYVDAPWPDTEKRFASTITRLDRHVGLLMDKLRDLGLEQNTVVIVTSDNGAHAAGGHDYTFFNSTGSLRGRKFSVHEGGIRVPFIARWPGRIPAGVTSSHPAAVWDLLPTLCELTGSPALPGVDGISMLPTLLGQSSKQLKHDYLYWETLPVANALKTQAARVDQWKAIRAGTNSLELYNLAADIGETTNVAAANPSIAARMQTVLANASTPPRHLTFPTNVLRTAIPHQP